MVTNLQTSFSTHLHACVCMYIYISIPILCLGLFMPFHNYLFFSMIMQICSYLILGIIIFKATWYFFGSTLIYGYSYSFLFVITIKNAVMSNFVYLFWDYGVLTYFPEMCQLISHQRFNAPFLILLLIW